MVNLTTHDPGMPPLTRPVDQCLTLQLVITQNQTTLRSGQTVDFLCLPLVPNASTSNVVVVTYNSVSSALGRLPGLITTLGATLTLSALVLINNMY